MTSVITAANWTTTIVGFCLALIEVRWPKHAGRLEKTIDGAGEWLQNVVPGLADEFADDRARPFTTTPLIVYVVIVVIIQFPLALVAIIASFMDDNVGKFLWQLLLYTDIFAGFVFPFFLFPLLVLGMGLLRMCIHWLNAFSHGHAIGTIGLILAAAGICLELLSRWLVHMASAP